MGLFLAKEYIKSEKKTDDTPFLLYYNGTTRILNPGERYFFPGDDFLEITYTGDEIELTYCHNEKILTNYENGILTFTVIELPIGNFIRQSILYPLISGCSAVHINKYVTKEKDNILARYMEYRD